MLQTKSKKDYEIDLMYCAVDIKLTGGAKWREILATRCT